GRTWSWVCENILSSDPLQDFPVVLGGTGVITVGIPAGLRSSTDGCTWNPPTGDPGTVVLDLAGDRSGMSLVAVGGIPSGATGLSLSSDGGRTWHPGATITDLGALTVEVAPDDPRRVYVSGNQIS